MGTQEDKYQWQIGSPPPSLDEHSQTKHKITTTYLKQYIDIYFQRVQIERLDLHLVDGFAGGGKYIDLHTGSMVDGSPFLALKTLEEAIVRVNIERKKTRTINCNFYFVEKSLESTNYLTHEIKNSTFNSALGSTIHCHNNEFHRSLPGIIKQIIRKNPRTQRAIFLLDQYAYKDVPLNSVASIFNELTDPEVILTFNYDSLQRYISNTQNMRTSMRNINLESHIAWDRIQEWKDTGHWHSLIQEQLAAAIKAASGAPHMTLFFISGKRGDSSPYWLVHLSKKYIARDVMMKIHWDHANDTMEFSHYLNEGFFQIGYRAYETPGQSSFEFSDHKILSDETKKRCIDKLSTEIPKIIYDTSGPIIFSDLLDQYGSLTPASSSEIKEALQTAIDQGEIEVRGCKGERRCKSTRINNKDTLTYKQSQLFI
ncbi:three-Cys-motif partner protein TcmP [Agaribacterium sp. ZY112]|uniref:three-Cys-motif partner protein TcmP n=1 Tax=Agaribacterium sp. ZY112 TaxID=3233574 RepID=UPI0035247601